MYTKLELLDHLNLMNLNPKGTLLIHSSMKAIGEVEGRAEGVLDVLCEYMKDGLLLFPTHSWDEKNLVDHIFNVKTETSCVGLLSNLFLQREGVIRSLHPTHSVAALGERSKEFVSHDTKILDEDMVTPCPRHGCFGSLYDEEAQIMFLGAPLTTNTYIHGVEELLNIPDRLKAETRDIKVIDYNQQSKWIKLIGHYNQFGDVSKNYDKLEDALLYKGIASVYYFGDAKCYIVQVKEMRDFLVDFLEKDMDLFVDKREIPKEWYMD